jgi:dienelactone hydrolase
MGVSGLVPTKAALIGAAFLLVAAGCAGPQPASFGGSRERVEDWASLRGFEPAVIDSGGFALFSLLRQRAAAATLPIYIEGDGAAWPTAFQPPRDPTPLQPVSLVLADRDPSAAVAYLGRPCQYLDEAARSRCDSAYWTERRFAPEVIAAFDVAVTRLKVRSGAQRVRLIGYSGGGVIAALLATRRSDVDALMTVAAPLALGGWTAAQGLSPLAGSLDPLAQKPASALTSAIHFVGADDAIVPPDIVARFVRARGGRLEVVAGFNHNCCWTRDWPLLLRRVHTQESAP